MVFYPYGPVHPFIVLGIDTGIAVRLYPNVSGLAAWSENCKWYSSLTLGAVLPPFFESL